MSIAHLASMCKGLSSVLRKKFGIGVGVDEGILRSERKKVGLEKWLSG